MTHRAIELLNEQQRNVKERSAPWMVAEQLRLNGQEQKIRWRL